MSHILIQYIITTNNLIYVYIMIIKFKVYSEEERYI